MIPFFVLNNGFEAQAGMQVRVQSLTRASKQLGNVTSCSRELSRPDVPEPPPDPASGVGRTEVENGSLGVPRRVAERG